MSLGMSCAASHADRASTIVQSTREKTMKTRREEFKKQHDTCYTDALSMGRRLSIPVVRAAFLTCSAVPSGAPRTPNDTLTIERSTKHAERLANHAERSTKHAERLFMF